MLTYVSVGGWGGGAGNLVMQVLFPAVFTVRSGGGGKKINLSKWQPHEPKEMYGTKYHARTAS